jgi:hypothetical protein
MPYTFSQTKAYGTFHRVINQQEFENPSQMYNEDDQENGYNQPPDDPEAFFLGDNHFIEL